MKKRSPEEIFIDDLDDLIFTLGKCKRSAISLKESVTTSKPFCNMYLDIEMHCCANLLYDFVRRYIEQGGKIKSL